MNQGSIHVPYTIRKLTPELADEAIKLVKAGATTADVINYLGCASNTFYQWLRNPKNEAQERLRDGMLQAEAERKLWCLQKIHKAAEKGDWKAAAWYLERRYPNEYARTQRITGEVTTNERSDALTEAIKATVRKMESSALGAPMPVRGVIEAKEDGDGEDNQ